MLWPRLISRRLGCLAATASVWNLVSRFVQTHVRVYRESGAIQVELWEHPRPARQQLRIAERIALAGRLPGEPERDAFPRVAVRASIEQA